MIYLDHNATTPLSEGVKKCIKDNLDCFVNPSSLYKENLKIQSQIKDARCSVARLINSPEDNIIFTGCATESNNTVFSSIFKSQEPTRHIVVSCVEHSAVLETARYYQHIHNVEVTYLPVDAKGRISVDELCDAIKSNTILVSVMLVNNELGNCYPISEISKRVHNINPNILVHTDATQAIGKMVVDVQKLEVDFLTLSGHKFCAPKGVGGLYIRDLEKFTPLLHGGHQEKGLRAGTENYLSIIAMGQAAKEAIDFNDFEKIAKLRDQFETKVTTFIRNSRVLGDVENRICNTSSILFDEFDGITLCQMVNELDDICISSGSACNSVVLKPSHVMAAIGLNQIPIRVSLGKSTTEEELDILFKSLIKATKIINRKGRK